MFTRSPMLSTDLSTSIPQERSIFVILVHYGAEENIRAAIRSLTTGNLRPDHVIVVDHAKHALLHDTAIVIRPEENTGYAGGLRAGLLHAATLGAQPHDLCVLLNNDVVFNYDDMKRIRDWWDVHGSPRTVAGAAQGYVSLVSGRAHILCYEQRAVGSNIPYIHGSCMVGEFSFLSSLPFPVSLFLYWEDVLLSMDICRNTGMLAVIPGLRTIHDDTRSVVSDIQLYYLVRNGAYTLERHSPPLWRLYWYTLNTVRMLYHRCRFQKKNTVIVRALVDARSGKLGKAQV